MEKVKQFYEALADDAGMKERAAKLSEAGGEQPDKAAATAAILAFAKAEGYDFTAEELAAYAEALPKPQGATELTDDEMNAVAGGGASGPNYSRCWDGWCYCTVAGSGKHTGSNTYNASPGCSTGGYTCACVIGGGGAKCSKGKCLVCPVVGVVDWEH